MEREDDGEEGDGHQGWDGSVAEQAKAEGGHVTATHWATQSDNPHLSEEDSSCGGPQTKAKALANPKGNQKQIRGRQVDANEAQARDDITDQEHLLPTQSLAGWYTGQDAEAHANGGDRVEPAGLPLVQVEQARRGFGVKVVGKD